MNTELVAVKPPEGLATQAEAMGLEFEADDIERLGLYLAHLFAANKQFNLTGVTEPDVAWSRHVLDSLTLLPYIASVEAKRVIDVGSGGGLPGIPLAIALPDTHFTLLEATGKKTRFLEETAAALGLSNVAVVNNRAETAGQDPRFRATYDVAVARAVGPLRVLAEVTVPFVKESGIVLAIKGRRAEEEVADAKQALHKLHVTVTRADRTPTGTVLVLLKTRPTPAIYPRRAGEPKRAPL